MKSDEENYDVLQFGIPISGRIKYDGLGDRLGSYAFRVKDRIADNGLVHYGGLAVNILMGVIAGNAIVAGMKIRSAVRKANSMDLTEGFVNRAFSPQKLKKAETHDIEHSEYFSSDPEIEYFQDNRGDVERKTFYRKREKKIVTSDGRIKTISFYELSDVITSIYDNQSHLLSERQKVYMGDSHDPGERVTIKFNPPGRRIGHRTVERFV